MAFPTGWQRIAAVTLSATLFASTLSDFRVPLTNATGVLPAEMLNSASANKAQADGGDIRFSTDVDGLFQIGCEVVHFGHDGAQVEIYVRVPSCSHVVDTVIYVWYKTGSTETQPAVTDTYGRNAVWSSGSITYNHVYHLGEASGDAIDATGNTDVAASGTPGRQATSPFGAGYGADFSNNNFFGPSSGDTPNGALTDFSITSWMNIDASQTNWFGLFTAEPSSGNALFKAQSNSSTTFGSWSGNRRFDGSVSVKGAGNKYYAITHEVSVQALSYLDGAYVTADTTYTGGGGPSGTSHKIRIGSTGGLEVEGILDEIRLTESLLTADWIDAEYKAHSAPATYIAAGTPSNVGTVPVDLTAGTGESTAEGVMPSLHIGRTLALASSPAEGAAEGTAAAMAAGAALDGTAAEAAGEGTAPALALGHDLAPAAGESAAEGVAPSIHIGRTLALASAPAEAAAEGAAPALALGRSFAAGIGEAAGEGLVPDLTIGSSAAVDLVAGIGESAGEGTAPALAIGTTPAAATGEAVGEGTAPALALGHDLAPAAGESAAGGVMPSLHIGRTMALASEPAEASASGAAPVLFIGLHGLPGIGDAIPEGLAPQLGLGAALAPGLGEAAADGLAPALDIAALVAAAHRTHPVTIADRRLALSIADRRLALSIADRRYTLES